MAHWLVLSRALAALLAASVGAAQASVAPRVEHHVSVAGDWRLVVSHDRFSERIVCQLRSKSGGALLEGQSIGFRFRRDRDVTYAVYRIDGGPPRTSRGDLPELTSLGTPIETGGVKNPTEGIVWIPMRLLSDANAVSIEPRPGDRPRLFHFRGMLGLYTVARERGCTPDARFVR